MRTTVWARTAAWVLFIMTAGSHVLAADKVVLGTGVDPAFAAFYVGMEKGFFKKHNIDPELRLFASGGASTPYLISGDINVSMAGTPAGVIAHARAPQVVMVAQVGAVRNWFAAVASTSIKDLPALRGKKLGLTIGTTSETNATAALGKVGMTLKDVSVVNVEPPEMLAALERGDIVAYFTWEPWVTRSKDKLGDRVHYLQGTTDSESQNNIYMERGWVQKNPDAAVRFLRGLKDTNDFIRTNPKESAQIASKTLKLEQSVVERLMAKCEYVLLLKQDAMAYLKSDVETLTKTNRIKGTFDFKGYVYPDLLRKVDPSLVDYKLPN